MHKPTRRLLILLTLLLTACSPKPEQALDTLNLPAATSQLLLVTTADWNTSAATLQRMEKSANHWQPVGDSIPVRVGRNGLGWGLGLHQDGAGVQKQEGDGKAPAGIFPLGTAFGYAEQAPAGVQMLYRQAGERDYFVDASDSPDYNHWRSIPLTEPNEPKQHWKSFERMRRDDHQYEYGMIVGHNMAGTEPGRGSAIFLHVWLDPATATSGCTAMDKENLLEVLSWLKPSANPVLVQVPADELVSLEIRPPY
ncbi:MAG: L,D-transpeptidase family protein [Gammaproteobacteria bacterium]|nr:L,D-transpeptidase family protein [Gammaproteobacteria bacterium]MBU1723459.1 L,D-transpeptidase family protein [Gammaproteobacteria bacterium]MBU2004419.1 L,D-transpeptidase family protein [Gammaproteobacteria bacterium]